MFVGAVSPPTYHLRLGPTTDMWRAITTSAVLNGQINCRPPKAALWPWQHSRPNCTTLGFQPGEQRCSLPLSCLCFIIFFRRCFGRDWLRQDQTRRTEWLTLTVDQKLLTGERWPWGFSSGQIIISNYTFVYFKVKAKFEREVWAHQASFQANFQDSGPALIFLGLVF